MTTADVKDGMLQGLGGPIPVGEDGLLSGIDPTLESCCRREVETNRKRSALESTLRRHDRVAAKEEALRGPRPASAAGLFLPHNVVNGMSFGDGCRCCYDPDRDGGEYAALTEARKESTSAVDSAFPGEDDTDDGLGDDRPENSDEGEDSSDDDEFDYLLNEELPSPHTDGNFDAEGAANPLRDLQARRRAELEFAALRHEALLLHGYGAHRQMDPVRALRVVGLGSVDGRSGADRRLDPARAGPAGAILHLFGPVSRRSAAMDLCLEGLAERYRGTRFVRALGSMTLTLPEYRSFFGSLSDKGLPALVAIRDGTVAAISPELRNFFSSAAVTRSSSDAASAEIEPRAVEQWLDRAGVLFNDPPPVEEICRIRPEEDALHQTMGMFRDMGAAAGKNKSLERYNCGLDGCNKAFYHEHVGIKTEVQDGLVVSAEKVVGADPTTDSS